MFKFLHILITCQWFSSVCVQWKRWLAKRIREKIATSLQSSLVFLQKSISIKRVLDETQVEMQTKRWKFQKHIEKLFWFITVVKDMILEGEAERVSGIFAELRAGLQLINNSTEHVCSPEKDVRSFLLSTGCSLLCYLRALEVPHYLEKLSPGWVGKPPRGSCSKF